MISTRREDILEESRQRAIGLDGKRGKTSESVFVNLLRSPGIDSKPGGPVLHRLAESIPGLRKRLQILAQVT